MQKNLFDDEDEVLIIKNDIDDSNQIIDSIAFKNKINSIIFSINELIEDSVKNYKNGYTKSTIFTDLQKLTSAVNTNINNFKINNPSSTENEPIEKIEIYTKKPESL